MRAKLFRHPHTGVVNSEAVPRFSLLTWRELLRQKRHPSAFLREFDCVAQEIDENLADAQRIPIEARVLDFPLWMENSSPAARAWGAIMAESCSISWGGNPHLV